MSHRLPGLLARPRSLECEIHVPISPTSGFFTMLHFLAVSIRRFGGVLRDSPLIVTVGGDTPADLAAQLPWSTPLGIEWRWVGASRFAEQSYFATAVERFRYSFQTPYVLFLDADLLLVAPPAFDNTPVGSGPGITGLIAHVPPFADPVGTWTALTQAAGIGAPPFADQHSGWGVMDVDAAGRYSPPYFNLGVLFADRDTAAAIGSRLYEEMANVDAVLDAAIFRVQVALTLAILRLSIPWHALPLRLNFPNDARFWHGFPEDAANIAVLHYLRRDEIDKFTDFEAPSTVDEALDRPVENPVNRLLQERLGELRPLVANGG